MQLTRAGFTLGTPYYMAPEQVLGQQVTHLVDVYSFGILLFEMLCGNKPISGDTIEKIFNKIREAVFLREAHKATPASK